MEVTAATAIAAPAIKSTACRSCWKSIAGEPHMRTISSRGRDPYTRAPITRKTTEPFCNDRCATLAQTDAR